MKIALVFIALTVGSLFGTSNAITAARLEFLFKTHSGGYVHVNLDYFTLFVKKQFKAQYSDSTVKDEDIEKFYKAVNQGDDWGITAHEVVTYLNKNTDQSVLAEALRNWDSEFYLDGRKLHKIFENYDRETGGLLDLDHFKNMVKTEINGSFHFKILGIHFTELEVEEFFKEMVDGLYMYAVQMATRLLQNGTSNPFRLFLYKWKN